MTLKKDGKTKQQKKLVKINKTKICPIDEIPKAHRAVIGDEEKNSTHSRVETDCGRDNATDSSNKLNRKPSLRRKFSALIRGSADLPAAINRGFQPIRRSLSFNRDLNRVFETNQDYRSKGAAHWYNSLSSLAEDETKVENGQNFTGNDVDYTRSLLSRTDSFIENPY
ncbi:hypothetical protein PV325_013204, partial [Microctonus aethiopoides]